MTTAYDELRGAAARLLQLVERYEVAINTGDSATRSSAPSGDGSRATGRLVEVTTLAAARAFVNAQNVVSGNLSADERDKAVDDMARRVAAKPEFRAAIQAAVTMVLTRQR